MSYQEYLNTNEYQSYTADNDRMGNNMFARAGLTFRATDKDEFTLSGMTMVGGHKNGGTTPYHYGTIAHRRTATSCCAARREALT